MVFALDMDDGGVLAFPSPTEAAAHCKGVDVADGFWRFFADDGSPLEARFERVMEPASATAAGTYTLHRAMSGLWLQERLDQVVAVKGCGITTIAELTQALKSNRGKRIGRKSTRG